MGSLMNLREGHLLMAVVYFMLGVFVGVGNDGRDAWLLIIAATLFIVLAASQFAIDTMRGKKGGGVDIFVPQ